MKCSVIHYTYEHTHLSPIDRLSPIAYRLSFIAYLPASAIGIAYRYRLSVSLPAPGIAYLSPIYIVYRLRLSPIALAYAYRLSPPIAYRLSLSPIAYPIAYRPHVPLTRL